MRSVITYFVVIGDWAVTAIIYGSYCDYGVILCMVFIRFNNRSAAVNFDITGIFLIIIIIITITVNINRAIYSSE